MKAQLPADLSQAIADLKAGNFEHAEFVLSEHLLQSPDSEHGWWLLSFATQIPAEQIACLQKLLEINPSNPQAQARLAQLSPMIGTTSHTGRTGPNRTVATGFRSAARPAQPNGNSGMPRKIAYPNQAITSDQRRLLIFAAALGLAFLCQLMAFIGVAATVKDAFMF